MKQYLLSIMKGQRKGFLAQLIISLLVPLSLVYGLGVFLHRNLYRLKGAYKAPKPVISIGNITVGGAGKTPLVIWLARKLQERGLQPVILIRGYMPRGSKDSDEADMLNEQISSIRVLTGADRVSNIVKSKDIQPVDVYIADDAFQHWPLSRDLNIVAIDAGNPFGNGHLLPAGILREGLNALKRAHVFVLTKMENSSNIQVLSSQIKGINPKALIVESCYKSAGTVDVFSSECMPENFLNDKHVIGFCAIADPRAFESSLQKSAAKISLLFNYTDHHVYKSDDIGRMLDFCRLQEVRVLVTTHKDAVKLRAFKNLFEGFRLVYMPIQLEITKGEDEFFQTIIGVCRG
jgi:tetraacyldisaccharide 4'-kinase